MRRLAICTFALGAVLGVDLRSAAFAQIPMPVGAELQVNQVTAGFQFTDGDSVAVADDGDFVVVWTSAQDGSGTGVFGRRFSSAGAPAGPEFQINAFTSGDQQLPAVATDADGDFVVTWTSSAQDGEVEGIFARRFASSGAALAVEFQVTVFTTGNQKGPVVASDADGDFVVAWHRPGDGSEYGVFARRFNAAGAAQAGEFQVNSSTMLSQNDAAIDLDVDGDFVVVWTSGAADPNVFGQRFSSNGARQGPEFAVNQYVTGLQTFSDVGMDAAGGFVIAWQGSGPGDAGGVFFRRFDSAGTPLGGDSLVESAEGQNQVAPSIGVDASGDFVVAYQYGLLPILAARHFLASGVPTTSSEMTIPMGANGQHGATGMPRGGDFVIAWTNVTGPDVFARRFDVPAPLDLDGNGRITALTDGLLLFRHLSGFTGTSLTSGAIGAGCTRCDAAAIVPYVDGEAGAVSQAPVREGGEFLVNSFTPTNDVTRTGSIAMENDGDFVVVWQSFTLESQWDVLGRRFSSAGVAFGTEFRVNAYTTNFQQHASVASDADGDFVVIWASAGQDGPHYGIFGRRFDSSGASLAAEFQVNAYTIGQQGDPSVAREPDGDFVVTWQDEARDGAGYGIFARRFNSAGAAQGGDFQVNATTTYPQRESSVDVDDDGDFVVVWQHQSYFWQVRGQRFSSTGSKQGPELAGAFLDGGFPVVGTAPNGSFVVAWNLGADLLAHRFDSSGAPVQGRLFVNSHMTGTQRLAALGVDRDGDFVVAWEGAGPGDDAGIFLKHFRASGVPTTGDVLVNSTIPPTHTVPAVGVDSEGDFVVAWSSYLPLEGNDVLAQRFDVPALFDIDGNGQVTALTDGQLVLRFLFGFTGSTLTSGAVDTQNCTRCDAAAIEPYLQTLM